MDRNTIVRWILIAGLMGIGWYFFFGKKSTEHAGAASPSLEAYVDAPGFAPDLAEGAMTAAPPGEACTIRGNRFQAEMSSRGAGLTHFYLSDAQYRDEKSRDVATTPDIEQWRNLRMLFKEPGKPATPDDQVKYDRVDWKTEHLADTGCRFSYEDEQVRIVKTVKAGERPFELDVETSVTNLADGPRKHTASIAVFAFRTEAEVKSKLGRVSPFQTGLECARGSDVKRLAKDASEFKTGWYSEPLADRYAAIANYYFAQTLVPMETAADSGGQKPACELLVQQDFRDKDHPGDDDLAGDVYKARLAYPQRILGPKETASYHQIAFFGPKERDVLAAAAGGTPHLQDLINLGTFAIV
ncbi:MAG TPA: membrane protein insertase YidC, partial [Polyangiaceae bacterium]